MSEPDTEFFLHVLSASVKPDDLWEGSFYAEFELIRHPKCACWCDRERARLATLMSMQTSLSEALGKVLWRVQEGQKGRGVEYDALDESTIEVGVAFKDEPVVHPNMPDGKTRNI